MPMKMEVEDAPAVPAPAAPQAPPTLQPPAFVAPASAPVPAFAAPAAFQAPPPAVPATGTSQSAPAQTPSNPAATTQEEDADVFKMLTEEEG